MQGASYGPPRDAVRTTWPIWCRNVRAVGRTGPRDAIRTTRPICCRNVRAVGRTDPQGTRSVRRGRFGAETHARPAVRTPRGAIRTTRLIWGRNVRAVGRTDPQEARCVRRGRFLPRTDTVRRTHLEDPRVRCCRFRPGTYAGPVRRTLAMLPVLTTTECGACRTDLEEPRSVRCCRFWPEACVGPTVRALGRLDPDHVDAFFPKRPSRDLWRPGSAQFRRLRRWECRPLGGKVRPVHSPESEQSTRVRPRGSTHSRTFPILPKSASQLAPKLESEESPRLYPITDAR